MSALDHLMAQKCLCVRCYFFETSGPFRPMPLKIELFIATSHCIHMPVNASMVYINKPLHNLNAGAITEEDFEKSFEDVPTISVIIASILCYFLLV